MTSRLPMVDLFAGAGGLSLGLSRTGFVPIVAVENDRYACETFSASHPNADVLEGDIRQINFRRLRGQVALVAGGPPCQPFSTGGLRLGRDDPRDGFPAFLRAVREMQPEAVLIENVAGLARGKGLAYLDALRQELSRSGFLVSTRVLAAVDYGVPQRRHRLFMIGTRNAVPHYPAPTHGPDREAPWVLAGDVIDPANPFGKPNEAIVTYAKRPDVRPSPYDGLLFNGGGRPIDLGAPARTILASAGGNKTPFLDTYGVVSGYHAALLRGESPRSGQVPGARRISVAESAVLQSFPLGMEFAGPQSAQYRLVGNAVPPRLAASVGAALRRVIEGRLASQAAA